MTSRLPEMPCDEFVERVSDYLEGALSPRDLTRLEEHLAACSHCAEYLDQLRAAKAVTGRLRATDVTPAMRGELLGIFARWQAGELPPGTPPGASGDVPGEL